MTSHGRSSCTTTSNMLITCGCCRRAPIRPSRMSRCRDSSSASPPAAVGGSAAPSSSLTATVRFSSSSVPRQTTPIAPAPIRWSSRYRLPIRGASSAGALIAVQDILRPSTTCRRGRSVRAGFATSLPPHVAIGSCPQARGPGLIRRPRSEDAGVGGATKRPRAGREQGTRCGSRTSSATRASRCTRHCRGSRWRRPPSGSTDADVGALVVCDGERRIRGIVSERDIVRGLTRRGAAVLEEPVESVMTHDVHTCDPQETVARAMALMTRFRYRHLPVVERGQAHGHHQHRRPGQAPGPRDGDGDGRAARPGDRPVLTERVAGPRAARPGRYAAGQSNSGRSWRVRFSSKKCG